MPVLCHDRGRARHQTGDNLALWSRAEASKRWVLATLGRWGWFTDADTGPNPRFHLLSEDTAKGHTNIIMGHQNGLVTINLAEADPIEEVRLRRGAERAVATMTAHFATRSRISCSNASPLRTPISKRSLRPSLVIRRPTMARR